jgi:hypothetical protein
LAHAACAVVVERGVDFFGGVHGESAAHGDRLAKGFLSSFSAGSYKPPANPDRSISFSNGLLMRCRHAGCATLSG